MHAQAEFGVKDVFTHAIGDMAKAICERPGEGKQAQFVRARVAAAMIVDFLPRDAVQVMLAGHCVMFHEVMTDSILDTLRGQLDTMRTGTRSNIVALNRAFHMNLDRLDRYQTRQAAGEAAEQAPRTESTAEASPPEAPVLPPEAAAPTYQDPPMAAAQEVPVASATPSTGPSPLRQPQGTGEVQRASPRAQDGSRDNPGACGIAAAPGGTAPKPPAAASAAMST
jgi:hypothetical protein